MVLTLFPAFLVACGGPSSTNPADLAYPTVSHLVAGGDPDSCEHGSIGDIEWIAVDAQDNIYLTDYEARFLRVDKVTPSGKVTPFTASDSLNGDAWRASYEGRPAATVPLEGDGLTVDSAGNVYITSAYGRVFRVGTDGRMHWIGGSDRNRSLGDGGPARAAFMDMPTGVIVDPMGNLYVSDRLRYRVRRISPDGRITTVAGNGQTGNMGDGGNAIAAQLDEPAGLALDPAGNLYIATRTAIRKVSREGLITTVAGNFTAGNSGSGGPAINAALLYVWGVAIDHRGNLYIAAHVPSNDPSLDGGLFVVTPDGIVHKIVSSTNGDQAAAVSGIAVGPQGNVFYSAGCGVYRLGFN